jgi:hypothetical protein
MNCSVDISAEALHKELGQTHCEWTQLKIVRRPLCLQSVYPQHKLGFKPLSVNKAWQNEKVICLSPAIRRPLRRHRNDELDNDALS